MIKKIKLRKQLMNVLQEKYDKTRGQSRDDAKQDGRAYDGIYALNTLKTYKKQLGYFIDYCYDKDVRTYDEAKQEITNYLDYCKEKGLSAWTISTRCNAICKAFDMRSEELDYKLPVRHRADITRSRGIAERDSHFSAEKNEQLIELCSAVGFRRDELAHCKGSNLVQMNGEYYVHLGKAEHTKGGRDRYAKIFAQDEKELRKIVHIFEIAGDGYICPNPPTKMDIHHYRHVYAQRAYKALERPLERLNGKEVYSCRAEHKGLKFDKNALAIASEYLGHGKGRVSTIVNHYLLG